jgi:hypothetical protein
LLTRIGDDGVVHAPFPTYAPTSAFPNIHYTAPEVATGSELSSAADIFSWAAIFYELLSGTQLLTENTTEEYTHGDTPVEKMKGMSPAFQTLLVDGLQSTSILRPTVDRFCADEAFQPIPNDKFMFLKSLPKVLNGFSERTARQKVISLLIEWKFAPILISPIFQFAKVVLVETFTNEVYLKLADLTTVLDPPQIIIALFHESLLRSY